MAAVLAGCGGGGGGSSPPEPTVLPSSLTLTVPETAQADTSVSFTSSAAVSAGLRHAWDFGDGGGSSQASPTHTYAQAGDFDVRLVVSNEAGQSIEQKMRVSVERTAALAGLECSATNAHGWCWLQPRPHGNLRYGMSFSDAQTGWIGGDAGQIWKTVDGGSHWTQQASGIPQSLRQVVFGSAQRGWALGAANDTFTLWTTESGGQSWQPLNNFHTPASSSTSYSGASLSWLGGEAVQVDSFSRPGMYLSSWTSRSTDGGKTWNATDGHTGQATAGGTRWRFEQRWGTGFGGFAVHGSVQRSLDGGISWQTVLPFPDATVGDILLAGEDTVLVRSWSQESAHSTAVPASRRFHLSRDRRTLVRAGTRDLWLTGTRNQVWRSTDGGATWTRIAVPGPDDATWGAAFFLDARRGWLDRGEVLRTEDGGQTWVVQPSGSSMAASGLQFLDAKTGWLWGAHGLLMTGSGGQ